MDLKARVAFVLSAVLLTALVVSALLPVAAAERPRTHTVAIEGMAFTPAELRVRPGERVVFENRDLLPHSATAQAAKTFDSGAIQAGASWSLTIAGEPRTIHYRCLYHPTMTGRIVIEAP